MTWTFHTATFLVFLVSSPCSPVWLRSSAAAAQWTTWAGSEWSSQPRQSRSLEIRMELVRKSDNTMISASLPAFASIISLLWVEGRKSWFTPGGEKLNWCNWTLQTWFTPAFYNTPVTITDGFSTTVPDSAVCATTVLLHGPAPMELKAWIWTLYCVQGARPSTAASLPLPVPPTSSVRSSPWPSVLHTCSRYPTVSGLLLYSDSGRGCRVVKRKRRETGKTSRILLVYLKNKQTNQHLALAIPPTQTLAED